jgi:hypothetical protein
MSPSGRFTMEELIKVVLQFNNLLASFGFGLVNTIFALVSSSLAFRGRLLINQPAIWTIDTFGRRNLLLFTFPMMAIMLLWAGSAFYMDVSSPHRVPLIAAGKSHHLHSSKADVCIAVYVYTAFYSPGMGPVPFV